MSLMVKDKQSNFQPAPEGTHAAVCTQIIDMGLQDGLYGEKEKLRISWEIDEVMDNGEPFVVSNMYTISLNEKASLRKDLEGWRGRKFSKEELDGFDMAKVLGKGCMISIVHNETDKGTYANVQTVSAMPKGMAPLEPKGELLMFSTEDPDKSVLEKLPEWLGDKVSSGMHRKSEKNGTAYKPQEDAKQYAELDDEIPF